VKTDGGMRPSLALILAACSALQFINPVFGVTAVVVLAAIAALVVVWNSAFGRRFRLRLLAVRGLPSRLCRRRRDKEPWLRWPARLSELGVEPGKRAIEVLNLERPATVGQWCDRDGEVVFWHELWSDRRDRSDDEPHYDDFIASNGTRLLISKRALRKFLGQVGMDLIVEIRNDRSNRGYGYGYHERSNEVEKTYDRVYCLKSDGTIETAIGSIGTW